MIEVKTKLRKWGNSFGIVVPVKAIEKEGVKEGDNVNILMKKEKKKNVLRETFGTMKFKKSVEEIMKEADRDLYND
jgi:antitoxin component of MazEF toxin-antitoxin module